MDEVNGVAGGQGRSAAEVVASTAPVLTLCGAFLAVVIAVLIAMLTGCATTYHEKDGELHPNLPAPSEFREICPM